MHEGHRQRIYEKMRAGEDLEEHEILEILLFNAYPRKNTNPIAHELLEAFGSARAVLEADYKELCAVNGVGRVVADYLKCVGLCSIAAFGNGGIDVFLRNYGDFKDYAARRLRNRTTEMLEIYLLEKNGRVKYVYSHTDTELHRVSAARDEISRVVVAQKPFGMIVAHNHVTGKSTPSAEDDNFTGEMQVLCALHGITLYDHCIYASDNDIYSYFFTGKIDEIKQKYSISAILKRGNS